MIPAFFTVIYLNFTFQVGIEFPVSIGLLTHGNFGLNGGLTHFAPGTDFSRMRIDFSKMAAYNTCQRKFQFRRYSTDEFGMSKDRFDFPLIC